MTATKTGFFRSVTAILLALIMLLSVLPVSAETADQFPDLPEDVQEVTLPISEGSARLNSSTYNNTSAFSTYVNNVMYSRTDSVARSAASSVLGSRLNKDEKVLYDALLKKIQSVADGKASSTRFKISFSPKFTRKSVKNSQAVLDEKIRTMISNVVYALLGDGPCEMYWFDQLSGWSWNYSTKVNKTHCWITNFQIELCVAKEYSASNTKGTIKVNTSKTKAARNAANNAKKIVQQNRGKSDAEKLRAYKNEICRLNDYNHAAAEDSSIAYGNPWQLIWVFDGDPNTKVVCEGYSKAFQYLCELSSFSGDVSCMSMGGYIYASSQSQGPHMWNVVKMPDNKRYLVDVTWCDEGDTGSDYLFLAGCIETFGCDFTPPNYPRLHYDKAYVFDLGNNRAAAYFFDTDVKIYKASDRNLSLSAFSFLSDTTKASGKCGADAEWSLNKGVLKIQGNGKMANYKSGSPAPWKQYAGSIKKIVIGDSITEIGKYAFDGLKAATTVTVGEKVKKIGNYAFKGCKKLKTFTFKGDKLKTIGSNAFKGLPKKVTFNCPAKKLDAYKKLLLKKGAPKNATFKKK